MGIQSEHHPRCTVIQSRAVNYLLIKLRQKDLPTDQFQTIGDRLMRLLGEEALASLPMVVEGAEEHRVEWLKVGKYRIFVQSL